MIEDIKLVSDKILDIVKDTKINKLQLENIELKNKVKNYEKIIKVLQRYVELHDDDIDVNASDKLFESS